MISALKVILPNYAFRNDIDEIEKLSLYFEKGAVLSEVRAEYQL